MTRAATCGASGKSPRTPQCVEPRSSRSLGAIAAKAWSLTLQAPPSLVGSLMSCGGTQLIGTIGRTPRSSSRGRAASVPDEPRVSLEKS